MDGLTFRVANKTEYGAELVCENVRTLTNKELTRVNDYSKKVKLWSEEWIKDMIEEDYWNWLEGSTF